MRSTSRRILIGLVVVLLLAGAAGAVMLGLRREQETAEAEQRHLIEGQIRVPVESTLIAVSGQPGEDGKKLDEMSKQFKLADAQWWSRYGAASHQEKLAMARHRQEKQLDAVRSGDPAARLEALTKVVQELNGEKR